MRQCLSDFDLGQKLFITELHTLKIEFHFFYKISCKISFQNHFKLSFFIIFWFFTTLKKIESNCSLTVRYALRPSQQLSIKINIGQWDGGTIMGCFIYIVQILVQSHFELVSLVLALGWVSSTPFGVPFRLPVQF